MPPTREEFREIFNTVRDNPQRFGNSLVTEDEVVNAMRDVEKVSTSPATPNILRARRLTDEQEAGQRISGKAIQTVQQEMAKADVPPATGQELRRAFIKLSVGDKDPAITQAKADILTKGTSQAVQDATLGIGGRDRESTIGALLGLLIPALAGAAIGGKTGALAGFAGAGKFQLKEIERQREADARIKEKALEIELTKAKEDRQLENQKELARFKSELDKEAEDPQKKTLETKIATNAAEAIDNAQDVLATLKVGDSLADELREVLKKTDPGVIEAQLRSRLDPNSEFAQVVRRMKGFMIQMVADQQSKPSDKDVQNILDIGLGGPLADGKAILKSFENVMKDSKVRMTSRLRVSIDGLTEGAKETVFRNKQIKSIYEEGKKVKRNISFSKQDRDILDGYKKLAKNEKIVNKVSQLVSSGQITKLDRAKREKLAKAWGVPAQSINLLISKVQVSLAQEES